MSKTILIFFSTLIFTLQIWANDSQTAPKLIDIPTDLAEKYDYIKMAIDNLRLQMELQSERYFHQLTSKDAVITNIYAELETIKELMHNQTIQLNQNSKELLELRNDNHRLEEYLKSNKEQSFAEGIHEEFSDQKNLLKSLNSSVHFELSALSDQIKNTSQSSSIEFARHVADDLVQAMKKPASCAEALSSDSSSGVHTLYIPNYKPIKAFCLIDPDGGDSWTILQRREDGSVNFDRGWLDYRNGFGNLTGEHWIGLEQIYQITKAETNEIWIKMVSVGGEVISLRHESFGIGSEDTKYELNGLGNQKGSYKYGLDYNKGMKFYTKDFDIYNCASVRGGGWWYGDCTELNPNGGFHEREKEGIYWYNNDNDVINMKYIHIAVRPQK